MAIKKLSDLVVGQTYYICFMDEMRLSFVKKQNY